MDGKIIIYPGSQKGEAEPESTATWCPRKLLKGSRKLVGECRAIEMAKSLKILGTRLKIPSTSGKKPGMAVDICNLSSGKVETGESLGLTGQPV